MKWGGRVEGEGDTEQGEKMRRKGVGAQRKRDRDGGQKQRPREGGRGGGEQQAAQCKPPHSPGIRLV